jgi:hypothetical protein
MVYLIKFFNDIEVEHLTVVAILQYPEYEVLLDQYLAQGGPAGPGPYCVGSIRSFPSRKFTIGILTSLSITLARDRPRILAEITEQGEPALLSFLGLEPVTGSPRRRAGSPGLWREPVRSGPCVHFPAQNLDWEAGALSPTPLPELYHLRPDDFT